LDKEAPLAGSIEALKKAFDKTVLRPDDRMDLARAALLIARLAYPDLDEPSCLAELDGLAARLKERIAGVTDLHRLAEEMTRLLCEEEGFRGNSKDYYDPDNSYLNRVLDRRTGIPITLSLVHMEVGRRAGLTVHGIGLPGHFITGLYGPEGRILMDPFYRGTALDEEECRRRVAVQYGGSKIFGVHLLEPVGPKEMLVRLLRNLKGIYIQMDEGMKTFQLIEWIISIDPNAGGEFKERGLIYENLGRFDLAARDMKKYLTLAPEAQDAQAIRSRIERLKEKTSRLH
jgi:regulator of sirC expression with transglutaminase-like and TPR domain